MIPLKSVDNIETLLNSFGEIKRIMFTKMESENISDKELLFKYNWFNLETPSIALECDVG